MPGGGSAARRLLVIAKKSPVPDHTGSRRRQLRLVQAASRSYDVHLAIAAPRVAPAERAALEAADLPAVTLLAPATRRPSAGDLAAWGVGRAAPLGLLQCDLQGLRRSVDDLLSAVRPDVVWLTGAWAHEILPQGLDVAVAVDAPHVESELVAADRAGAAKGLLVARVRRALDGRARLRAERLGLARAQLVTACSAQVATAVAHRTPGRVVEVPNGVDLVGLGALAAEPSLLLVGNLGYGPNLEAARMLVDEVLPAVRAEVGEAHLRVVGQAPDAAAAVLRGRPGVEVVGPVDDLAREYGRAALVVAPILSGSGTRVKVLEAFAHGVPVVTTAAGVEGLAVRHDREVFVASDPTSLAAGAVALLQNRARADRQREAAHAFVADGLDWRRVGAGFTDALDELVADSTAAAGVRR